MAEPGHRTEGENGMTGKFARFGGAALASALLVLTACNASGNKSASAPGAETWSEFRDDFLDGYFPLNPTFAVSQGKHEFDGQLPDWSPEGIEKPAARSEERRVGKECVSTCRTRGSTDN